LPAHPKGTPCKKCGEPKTFWHKDARKSKGGVWDCEPCEKARRQTPEYKAARKARDKARMQTPEYKASNRARQRAESQRRMEAGLCVVGGCPDQYQGYSAHCLRHNAMRQASARERAIRNEEN
jgi:hypothetical protein